MDNRNRAGKGSWTISQGISWAQGRKRIVSTRSLRRRILVVARSRGRFLLLAAEHERAGALGHPLRLAEGPLEGVEGVEALLFGLVRHRVGALRVPEVTHDRGVAHVVVGGGDR